MSTIRVNGTEYYYARRGDGPALLLLHGFTGSSESWGVQIETFAQKMDVIAVDLLGHGRTESPQMQARYAAENAVKDIFAILLQLDLRQVNVLGYSMGGRLALYLANQYPTLVKALVLESASPGLASAADRKLRQANDDKLAQIIEREGITQFVDSWEQVPLFDSQRRLPAQKRAVLRRQRLQNNPAGLANSLRGFGTGSQPSLWGDLPAIQSPTLLLCGELDHKFVQINREMAGLMPQAELAVIPETGHNIHFERPVLFAKVVEDFLVRP